MEFPKVQQTKSQTKHRKKQKKPNSFGECILEAFVCGPFTVGCVCLRGQRREQKVAALLTALQLAANSPSIYIWATSDILVPSMIKTDEAADHHDKRGFVFVFLTLHFFFSFLSFQTRLNSYTDSHNVPEILWHVWKSESPVNSRHHFLQAI